MERVYQTTQSLHVATASLQFHSASVNAQLERLQQTTQSLQVATASLQVFSSSVNDQLQRVYQTTQSLHVATASIQLQTASLLAFTASQDSRNFTLSQVTASFNYFYQATASLQAFTASQADRNLILSTVTGSINQATASLQTFTASQDGRNLTLSTVTGSLIGITNGLMAFTAALDNTYATDAQLYQLYQATRSLELHSGSMVGVTNGLMAFTSSLRNEVNGIESYTSSLKAAISVNSTDATILGSLTINQNLVVLGSASIQYITSSQLNIGDNIISVNTSTPSIRFGGFSVIDSGSNPQQSGSILFDSVENQWIFVHQTVGTVTSSLLLMGPQTYNNIGGETNLTPNRLLKSVNSEHVGDTNITDNGTDVIVNSNTQITGSLRVTAPIRTNIISGGLDVNGGITGSVKGNLDGVANYASTVAVANTGTTTDTTLFPIFSLSPVLGSYTSLYSHASSSFFYNGVTRRLHMEGFVVSGSNNIAEISGSLNVSGSSHTIQSGYVILQQVSQSLNFVDDTAAAAGGVPLGGLYRNGNFIVIRIV